MPGGRTRHPVQAARRGPLTTGHPFPKRRVSSRCRGEFRLVGHSDFDLRTSILLQSPRFAPLSEPLSETLVEIGRNPANATKFPTKLPTKFLTKLPTKFLTKVPGVGLLQRKRSSGLASRSNCVGLMRYTATNPGGCDLSGNRGVPYPYPWANAVRGRGAGFPGTRRPAPA